MVEFVKMFTIERVTHIYWQVDCPSIVGFVRVFTVDKVTYIY
jgi:hypothetical protein